MCAPLRRCEALGAAQRCQARGAFMPLPSADPPDPSNTLMPGSSQAQTSLPHYFNCKFANDVTGQNPLREMMVDACTTGPYRDENRSFTAISNSVSRLAYLTFEPHWRSIHEVFSRAPPTLFLYVFAQLSKYHLSESDSLYCIQFCILEIFL